MLAVQITDQVSLGVLILTGIVTTFAVARLLFVVPTKIENANLRRQLGDSRAEVDTLTGEAERRKARMDELGAEKDAAQQAAASAEARASELAKRIASLPDWPAVQKFTMSLLEHVDEKAAERQNSLAQEMASSRQLIIEQMQRTAAEIRAENADRYEALQAAHAAIIEATTSLVREVRAGHA